MRSLVTACCLIMSLPAVSLTALAQDSLPRSAYQQGASAYFAGRTDLAEEHLSTAIQENPSDPRAHYLRGLNRLAVANTNGAQIDLAEGARLEAQLGSASPLVDRSLASVQGSARLTLERIRREARQDAELEARQSIVRARREQRLEREKLVLRTDYQLPLESLASRLTVEQARQVATKVQPEAATAIASNEAAGTSEAEVNEDDNPFVDDSYNEDDAFAATTGGAGNSAAATDSTTNDVEVPQAARGSMKAGSLFSLFGKVVGSAAENSSASSTARGLAEKALPGMGPMGPAGMQPGGMGAGDFEMIPENGQPSVEFNFTPQPAGGQPSGVPANGGDEISPFDLAE